MARLLLTIALAGYAILTLRADLGETHARNPRWRPHARFHVVWQAATNAGSVLLGLGLIWWPGAMILARFYLAAVIGGIILAAFYVTTLTQSAFGGALRDEEGEEPLRVKLGTLSVVLDTNVILFTGLAALLVAGVVITLV
jgi:hypothetical protein